MKKIKAAITGNIGSGKSSFCKFLEDKNHRVIKADEIAKELMISDQKVRSAIINKFGESSYDGKELNRKYLAEKIFSDPINTATINSIVHTAVIKKVEVLMDELLKTSHIVFHEAALIYEAAIENKFDVVVLITADHKIRLNRVVLNYKLSEEEFNKRERSQIPQEEKIKSADFVFANNGSLDELRMKANLLLKILEGMLSN